MRLQNALVYGFLSGFGFSLLAGCGGGNNADKDEGPRNPMLGPPERGAGGLRRVGDMPKVRNELRNIAQLYTAYFADRQKYPATEGEFKAYLKRDPNAKDLYQALEQGFYVVVPTRNPSSAAVLAY